MKPVPSLGLADLLGENLWFADLISFSFYRLVQQAVARPRSMGRGVLLIPGFLSGDYSLGPLAISLRALGYRVFFSGIWYNVDCPDHTLPRLENALRKAQAETHQKVALIGHSLGGMYARELAFRFPYMVARAILLGSAIRDPLKSPNPFLPPLFAWWHKRCSGGLVGSSWEGKVEPRPSPPQVPETLIYSKSDGVVQWQNCIESGPQVEAIEVASSHLGLPYRPEVFEIIVDRLARFSERRHSPLASAVAPGDRVSDQQGTGCAPSERLQYAA